MKRVVSPSRKLAGIAEIPGDKSISHRAMIFGAIASGRTVVRNLLDSGDVHSTQDCLRALGVRITPGAGGGARETVVEGVGKHGLREPLSVLDCGNSGTTMRLMMGLLAGQGFEATLTGDDSLIKRPMKRVAAPLAQMGAQFSLTREDYAPLTVHGRKGARLKATDYSLKVASAQVKTSLLLAGLYADGVTTLRGELGSRDHTERMLPHFGVKLRVSPDSISVDGEQKLTGCEVHVPGDPSSAAFWMAAAALVPGADVEIRNVSLNPTRIGFMRVLERMGARVEYDVTESMPEPRGNVRVRQAALRGTSVEPGEIPSLIDELPVLAVLATQAEGETVVHGARELRVKESDRIEAVARNLRAMGGVIETFEDGYAVRGIQKLRGARIDSFLDHRIAMSFAIAGLIAQGDTEIEGVESVLISYPNFFEVLNQLTGAK